VKSEYFHRTTCRLCGGVNLTRVLALPATPPANAFVPREKLSDAQASFPLDVYFCETCGHLQLLDVVDPEILFRDYVYVSGTSPSFVRHFEAYAQDCIARFTPMRGGLALDIGSNDGSLLQFFKVAGMEVLGIDPARKIAAVATARGLETWPEFLNADVARRVLHEKGSASIITANNVFAHVDDLPGLTDCIRDLLADEGVYIFEVSYAADVHANVLFDTIYHEHLDYHTVAPLVPFFAAHGLELFAARRVNTHGGSLRGYVQRAGGPHQADGSVQVLIDDERAHNLGKVSGWTEFAERIDRLGKELTSLLCDLKGQGKRIAGFGAPAKATTLMYRFGLGSDVIDYIIDDSPLKQGLFTPGKHVPVVAEDHLAASWPDYLVVLAWNFADPIIANHREYLDKGGHFIVPLPELRIV
jgi:SAM-dependent methyltransferase